MTWLAYPTWLNPGDNAWQMTAATFVGLMSVPGLAVLYGGVMQKRWSVNSMMLTFVAFCLVLVAWCLWAFKMGFGTPIGSGKGFFDTFWGKSGTVLSTGAEEGQAVIPSITEGPPFHFPKASLVYFQFVFAAITPILMLGSVLGRDQLQGVDPVRAAVDHVRLHGQRVPDLGRRLLGRARRARLLGRLRHPSRGRHLRLRGGGGDRAAPATRSRDRRAEQPADGRCGAGLLWLGWNGFNGGDSYYAGANASAAVVNTNLCTAVACSCGSRGTTSSATSRR